MSTARSVVQGVEVWTRDGEVLRSHSGVYLDDGFARASKSMAFRRGEGLPGAVWVTERAVLWRQLGIHFVRADLARPAHIDAALGAPIMRGNELAGVVVFFFAAQSDTGGCVELWNVNDELGVLKHAGGQYVGCADLERMSRLLQFQRGVGLPGQVWGARAPVIMADVGRASSFVRSTIASQLSLQRGFGLPLFHGNDVMQVVTFLARATEPFLAGVEIWVPGEAGLSLLSASGCRSTSTTAEVAGPETLAGLVAVTGIPHVVAGSSLEGGGQSGWGWVGIALAVPLFDGPVLRHVACLMF